MKEKKQYNPFKRKNALIYSLIISFLIHLILLSASILNYNRAVVLRLEGLGDILISFLCNALILYILFRFSFLILQQKWSRLKRKLFIIFGLLILTIGFSFLLSETYTLVLSDLAVKHSNLTYKNLMLNMVYMLIVLTATVAISEIVKNQRIVSENTLNRYEALKNQLDPHFLFNSFNTLDGLIGYDDEKAHDYLQNLSFMFRHTIQNKEIIELKQELKYIDSYAYLMKIRYGDNFILNYKIDPAYSDYFLLHASLQILIEYAIRSNIIDDKHRLCMTIETTNHSTVKILNHKNQKIDADIKTNPALEQLQERYKLLFGRTIEIIDNQDFFMVELPLIEQLKVYKLKRYESNYN